MISKNITQALSDAAQNVLRPLVRVMLRNGIPYGVFADIARHVYVEIGEKDFALPGKKQTVSRISTITGLTRKEVTRIQAAETVNRAAHSERYHRPARGIGGWVRDKAYHDRKGRPADLPVEGETGSFSALVRDFSGDIPPRAIADELARVGAIEILPNGNVRLLTRAYIPRGDQVAKIGILGESVSDSSRTIDHNWAAAPAGSYLQGRVNNNTPPGEMMPAFKKKTARKAQSCLEPRALLVGGAEGDPNPAVKGTG